MLITYLVPDKNKITAYKARLAKMEKEKNKPVSDNTADKQGSEKEVTVKTAESINTEVIKESVDINNNIQTEINS